MSCMDMQLLAGQLSPAELEVPDKQGRTPVWAACSGGKRLAVVEYLVERLGLDPELASLDGYSVRSF